MGFSGLLPPSVSEVSSSSAQALFGHVLYFTPGDKAHAGVRCGCLGVRKIHPLRVTFGFPLGSHNWEFRRKFGPVPDPVRPNSAQIRAIFGQKVAPKVFTRLGTNLQPNLHSLGQIVSDPPPKTLSHKSTPSPSLGFFFRVGVAVLPPPPGGVRGPGLGFGAKRTFWEIRRPILGRSPETLKIAWFGLCIRPEMRPKAQPWPQSHPEGVGGDIFLNRQINRYWSILT